MKIDLQGISNARDIGGIVTRTAQLLTDGCCVAANTVA